jgi:hypothetical protein
VLRAMREAAAHSRRGVHTGFGELTTCRSRMVRVRKPGVAVRSQERARFVQQGIGAGIGHGLVRARGE